MDLKPEIIKKTVKRSTHVPDQESDSIETKGRYTVASKKEIKKEPKIDTKQANRELEGAGLVALYDFTLKLSMQEYDTLNDFVSTRGNAAIMYEGVLMRVVDCSMNMEQETAQLRCVITDAELRDMK